MGVAFESMNFKLCVLLELISLNQQPIVRFGLCFWNWEWPSLAAIKNATTIGLSFPFFVLSAAATADLYCIIASLKSAKKLQYHRQYCHHIPENVTLIAIIKSTYITSILYTSIYYMYIYWYSKVNPRYLIHFLSVVIGGIL